MALDADQAGVAQLLEVVRERRLADVEQRLQLADADLAGVAAQHVDELHADRVRQRLGDLRQPHRALRGDVGKDDRLTARLAGRPLGLRDQL